MQKKILLAILLLIGLSAFAFGATDDAKFLEGVNQANAHADQSIRGNVSIWGKLFFGLFPVALAFGTPFIVHKIYKKKAVQTEDDDGWKIIIIDLLAFGAGVMLGLMVVFFGGEFLLIKHGGGDAGLTVFSTFWSSALLGTN